MAELRVLDAGLEESLDAAPMKVDVHRLLAALGCLDLSELRVLDRHVVPAVASPAFRALTARAPDDDDEASVAAKTSALAYARFIKAVTPSEAKKLTLGKLARGGGGGLGGGSALDAGCRGGVARYKRKRRVATSELRAACS